MKYLIQFILTSSIMLCTIQVYSQFGIRLKYNSNDYVNFENAINKEFKSDVKLFNSGYEAGIDYWFRLKKKRVEFMPELSYSYASSNIKATEGLTKMHMTSYNFNFHTHIYALDMEGDCDCPTFSKQGASFNKGLFFHFTPGIGYYTADATTSDNSSINYQDDNALTFHAGIGIGLDLGISDLLTITPILSYYFNSKMTWEGIPTRNELATLSDNLKTIQLTIRMGFRPDYNNGRRRR